MYLPPLKQLQYLVAVVELQHFGKAAERCFVTQSTISTGIQELEGQLGVQLLERTKRKVAPTPMGKELARQAAEIVRLAVELVDTARTEHAPLSGPLKLGVIPTIGPFLLPKMLPKLRKRYPQLELYLIEDQSAKLLERLESSELDCALFALPYDLGRMESEVIARETFWVAFPHDHPLSEGGPIPSIKLPADELLLLEEGHCLRDHVITACRGLKRSSAFQGTSLYTLLEMVSGGQGITLLPEMAIHSGLVNPKRISLRPLSDQGPHRDIALIWRNTCHRKKELKLLSEEMRAILAAAKG